MLSFLISNYEIIQEFYWKKMEDFLNDINDECIQIRIQNIKLYIFEQRNQIIKKLHGYKQELLSLMNNKVAKKSSIQSNQNQSSHKNIGSRKDSSQINLYFLENKEAADNDLIKKNSGIDEKQKCFSLFQKACQNILNIYFPLLMDDQILSLQSEAQINIKLSYLTSVVEKTAISLIKKLTKAGSISDLAQKQNNDNDQQNDDNSVQISPQNEQKSKKIKKQRQKLKQRKGKNSKIPNQSACILQKWLLQNFNDPYPSQLKKQQMANQSGLTVHQVNNWFINARQRVIKKFLKKDSSSNPMISTITKSYFQDEQRQKPNKERGFFSKRQSRYNKSHNSIKLSKQEDESSYQMVDEK